MSATTNVQLCDSRPSFERRRSIETRSSRLGTRSPQLFPTRCRRCSLLLLLQLQHSERLVDIAVPFHPPSAFEDSRSLTLSLSHYPSPYPTLRLASRLPVSLSPRTYWPSYHFQDGAQSRAGTTTLEFDTTAEQDPATFLAFGPVRPRRSFSGPPNASCLLFAQPCCNRQAMTRPPTRLHSFTTTRLSHKCCL